jgi:hypothetical protein
MILATLTVSSRRTLAGHGGIEVTPSAPPNRVLNPIAMRGNRAEDRTQQEITS